jgi:dihydroorotase/N-acyl-D-amino-acid deacylase
MVHPQNMIASDGRLTRPGIGHPHPRWYGTFPRVLGYYAREKGIMSMEEAIRKMTSLPAARLGLDDRGVIKPGNYADLVLFDPDSIIDKATFEKPHQYPQGIQYVIVNGLITVENGEFTNTRGGRVLYGPAKL